ncbi:GNAT family N-acetyltransferase [Bermanella marisrubri]|uniref:GNAT family N-acetyltransferase n=1 Tax=Bermanella marisrubri TaxID=207949 RepID=Q1MYG5_9GAMM|nr:peptidogalycan biosysnthesis protein [Bermanella marisrubri]EAT10980.1 hypothetical protein RED65_02123 [Oceanobacter sp. RED65] [Bermanella marisrubri]QIZ83774.1 GNAT family N-acetyltransferase [Bermanella marisrubri]
MQCFNDAKQWSNHNPSLHSKNEYPFIQTEFLQSLESNNSLNQDTGWQSHYLSLADLDMAVPAFIKHHSYGEYVFDWAWADAYARHGLVYYPKLIVAAPYTPATGPRILSSTSTFDGKELSNRLFTHCEEKQLSGAHILFPTQNESQQLIDHGWQQRLGVQFHWYNRGYENFEHFLSHFKSRKRKNIIKERAQFQRSDMDFIWREGHAITQQEWQDFYFCYQRTYAKRGMQGYITLEAFKEMATMQALNKQMHLLVCRYQHQNIAFALFFSDSQHLYGRYWGCVQDIHGLHFEACYYRGIEFAIAKGLKVFNPGTQGEHKISRGFEPVLTQSLHYLSHPDFHQAVSRFVKEEAEALLDYQKQCYEELPFNETSKPAIKRFSDETT